MLLGRGNRSRRRRPFHRELAVLRSVCGRQASRFRSRYLRLRDLRLYWRRIRAGIVPRPRPGKMADGMCHAASPVAGIATLELGHQRCPWAILAARVRASEEAAELHGASPPRRLSANQRLESKLPPEIEMKNTNMSR